MSNGVKNGDMEAFSGKDVSKKREDYLNWPDYFMAVAFLSAMRSKDPCSQVGACIVNAQNKVVGIGYNGMPFGCSDDDFPWGKESDSKVENKYFYVCHAEMNAILNKIVGELRGCHIYVAMFPCNECAKLIIQSGISEVYYFSNKNWNKDECIATRKMFDAAGIKYTQYIPTRRQIVIDFDTIDWNKVSQAQDPPTPKKKRTSS
ncbi:unnamed protein product [Allacma fusca]|uniref:Probable deoxycytidylate deaminase n=1 Tax=Allacma fusca TaxID=39272 RepID=A0A8J2KVB5_9HEXA|nr:unnamed protein product [Allacma fusca]